MIGRWGQQKYFPLKIQWSALRFALSDVDLKFEGWCSEQVTVFKSMKYKERKEVVVKESAVFTCSMFSRIGHYLNAHCIIANC